MLADLFTPIKVYVGHFHNSQSKKILPLSDLLQGEARGNKVLFVSVVLHHFIEKRRNSLKVALQVWGTDELLLNSKNNNKHEGLLITWSHLQNNLTWRLCFVLFLFF